MKRILVLTATVMAMGSTALARGADGGTYLGLHLAPQSSGAKTESGGSTSSDSTTTAMPMDVNIAYVMPSGLLLGVIYSMTSGSTKDNVSGGESKTSGSGYGVSVGYRHMGFVLTGHYYLNSTYKFDSSDTEYSKGSGLGIDIGYLFNVTGTFNIGAILAYRSIKYTGLTVSGTDVSDSSLTSTGYQPMLAFGFLF